MTTSWERGVARRSSATKAQMVERSSEVGTKTGSLLPYL